VNACTRCGSYAINPDSHGRNSSADLDLCDLCYWRKRADVRGLDFHCETALTQARMAWKHCALLAGDFRFRPETDAEKAANAAALSHLASVIEQLEEMAAKLKAAKERD